MVMDKNRGGIKTFIVSLFLLIIAQTIIAQKKAKAFDIYREKVEDGYRIYADNNSFFPISGKIKFKKYKNLNFTNKKEEWYVVPANTKRKLLTELKVIDNTKPFYLHIGRYARYGDYYQKEYDKNFEYHLPFENNSTYYVLQGYNGSFSHRGINAIDFRMPEGTKVYAARGGRVIRIKEDSNIFCPNQSCSKYANYIMIYHFDGTIGEYHHIQKNGVVVDEGDVITIGQHIGYSGNTGFSTEPHLHFQVSLYGFFGKYSTLKTKFLVHQNKPAIYLSKDKGYTNYFKSHNFQSYK